MDVDKIELKTAMTAAEVAGYLASLAEGFKVGRIVVEKGEERLALSPDPDGPAEAEIEARIKKGKARFTLELTWRMQAEGDESAPLRILSAEAPCQAETAPSEASDTLAASAGTASEVAEALAPAEATDAAPAAPAEVQEAAPVSEGSEALLDAAAEAKPKAAAKARR